jgi:hypothetical protein
MKGVGKDAVKYLNDFQYGVGVSGGAEAILHSANMVMSQWYEDDSLQEKHDLLRAKNPL